MKKLLILAFDFPPYVSVGGLRPYNWYRYLKEYGVEPVVVTRQWSNTHGNHLDYISAGESEETIVEETNYGTIIRTPYSPNYANRLLLNHGEEKRRLLRKAVSGYYEFAQFLKLVGPKAGLYHGAREYLKNNKVDAIIATGDPFVLFSYASKLSKEFGIPWIADYRDTWIQDKNRSGFFLTRKWNAYFEKKYLKNVATISTVSKFIQKNLELNLKGKSFEIILNGFNPDAIEKTHAINQQNEHFTISFAGTIYKWHPIESFLKTCYALIVDGELSSLKINFYGINNPEKVEQLLHEKYMQLLPHVNLFPKTENEALVKILARSNAFLLFNDYSILGTKIFTYLGIRRKMILCYSDDPEANALKKRFYNIEESGTESKQLQADLIEETNSGIIVKDTAHLKLVLQDLYAEFQEKGFIACESVGVEKYSRKIQVEKLAKLIASF